MEGKPLSRLLAFFFSYTQYVFVETLTQKTLFLCGLSPVSLSPSFRSLLMHEKSVPGKRSRKASKGGKKETVKRTLIIFFHYYNIYTLLCASTSCFISHDARIIPSSTERSCITIEHSYYKNNSDYLLIDF